MGDGLTPEAFASWANAVGLQVDAEHLALLQPETQALLGRIAPLEAIDVSGVAIEDAIGGAS